MIFSAKRAPLTNKLIQSLNGAERLRFVLFFSFFDVLFQDIAHSICATEKRSMIYGGTYNKAKNSPAPTEATN